MAKEIHGPNGKTFEPDEPLPERDPCCEEGQEPPECSEPPDCFETIASLGAYRVDRIPEGYIVVHADTGEQVTPVTNRMKALALLASLTARSGAPWRSWRREARQDGIRRWVR